MPIFGNWTIILERREYVNSTIFLFHNYLSYIGRKSTLINRKLAKIGVGRHSFSRFLWHFLWSYSHFLPQNLFLVVLYFKYKEILCILVRKNIKIVKCAIFMDFSLKLEKKCFNGFYSKRKFLTDKSL